jgi:hypothetical protein
MLKWAMGCLCLGHLRLTWVGRKHILIPTFDAAPVLSMNQTEKISRSNLIPTMLNMMVNIPYLYRFDYYSLRVILIEGCPLRRRRLKRPFIIFPSLTSFASLASVYD